MIRLVRGLGIVALVVGAMAVLPESVWACPVCFDANDENRQAFLITTAFLSLLPLGMVFGAGLWIRKRNRDIDELYGNGSETRVPEPSTDEL